MSLPSEVRCLIWYYALQDPEYDNREYPYPWKKRHFTTLHQKHDAFRSRNSNKIWALTVGDISVAEDSHWGQEAMTRVLRVNKTINAEATEVLYSKFDFVFDDFATFTRLKKTIGPGSRDSIRTITLPLGLETYTGSRELAHKTIREALPNLKKVTILANYLILCLPWDMLKLVSQSRSQLDEMIDQWIADLQVYKTVKEVVVENFEYSKSWKPDIEWDVKERVESGLRNNDDVKK